MIKIVLRFFLMHLFRLYFRLYSFFSFKYKPNQPFKRILISSLGGVGDLIIGLSILPVLRSAFLNCQVDLVVSPWAKEIAKSIEGIEEVYGVECWKFGKNRIRTIVNWFKFNKQQGKEFVNKIKKKKYDAVFELRALYPNLIWYFAKAKIPIRIGFEEDFFPHCQALLTYKIPLPKQMYYAECYRQLLKHLEIDPLHLSKLGTLNFHHYQKSSVIEFLPQNYILFHAHSAEERKEFPMLLWKELKELFEEQGYAVFFSGKGEREKQHFLEMAFDTTLCDLSWNEWVEAIKRTSLLIAVDTGAVHIAAALRVPFIALYRCYSDLWWPNRSNSLAFIEKDASLPLTLKQEDEVFYVRDQIEAEEIFNAAKLLLDRMIIHA